MCLFTGLPFGKIKYIITSMWKLQPNLKNHFGIFHCCCFLWIRKRVPFTKLNFKVCRKVFVWWKRICGIISILRFVHSAAVYCDFSRFFLRWITHLECFWISFFGTTFFVQFFFTNIYSYTMIYPKRRSYSLRNNSNKK